METQNGERAPYSSLLKNIKNHISKFQKVMYDIYNERAKSH
jgi:hypothetical protein